MATKPSNPRASRVLSVVTVTDGAILMAAEMVCNLDWVPATALGMLAFGLLTRLASF